MRKLSSAAIYASALEMPDVGFAQLGVLKCVCLIREDARSA